MLAECNFPRDDSASEYLGWALMINNSYHSALKIAVKTAHRSLETAVETTVPAGETLLRREFVAAEPGEIVTLAARVKGNDRYAFTSLSAGSGDAAPEYAHLNIKTPVSVRWSARPGTDSS